MDRLHRSCNGELNFDEKSRSVPGFSAVVLRAVASRSPVFALTSGRLFTRHSRGNRCLAHFTPLRFLVLSSAPLQRSHSLFFAQSYLHQVFLGHLIGQQRWLTAFAAYYYHSQIGSRIDSAHFRRCNSSPGGRLREIA